MWFLFFLTDPNVEHIMTWNQAYRWSSKRCRTKGWYMWRPYMGFKLYLKDIFKDKLSVLFPIGIYLRSLTSYVHETTIKYVSSNVSKLQEISQGSQILSIHSSCFNISNLSSTEPKALKIRYNTIMDCYLIDIREHSQITWTCFWHFLTTYLPLFAIVSI